MINEGFMNIHEAVCIGVTNLKMRLKSVHSGYI